MWLSELVPLKLNIETSVTKTSSGRFRQASGFTLLEVLFALVISGILLVTSLHLLTDQWRGARGLRNHLEAHYSVMTAGRTVCDAIRMAKTVEWVENYGVLKIMPMPDDSNPLPTLDSYFIDDLDRDGTKDLYWRHLGVSQPLASYISLWQGTEVEPGLWDVFLEARVEGQTATWRTVIRQRANH